MVASEHESLNCEAALMKFGFQLETGSVFKIPFDQKSVIHSSEGSYIIMVPAK